MRNLSPIRGKWLAALISAAALGALVWIAFAWLGPDEGQRLSAQRMFIDATTGQPFMHRLSADEAIPVVAPTGGRTGFPAEPCYWTVDGKAKPQPTWVLIGLWKGSREPTFCPDCGRLVVGHNPAPRAGQAPPPTRNEYFKNRNGTSGQ